MHSLGPPTVQCTAIQRVTMLFLVSSTNGSHDLSASSRRRACRWGSVDYFNVDVTTPIFGERFGEQLKSVRKARGTRLWHLSNAVFNAKALRSVERGDYPLEPVVVAELAALYGVELDQVLPSREPVRILATGVVASGGIEETFEPMDIDSMLGAYLRLIARLRGADPGEAFPLRREDLIEIADQLERPRPEIVDRVAVLMGVTGSQRRAMVDLYLSGALVVGVAN